MGSRIISESAVRLMTTLLALGLGACSSVNDGDRAERRETTGTVTIPLRVTAPSGVDYFLDHPTFVVRDARQRLVAVLESDSDPEVTTISRDLAIGRYTVELLDGWALRRVADGRPETVDATLTSGPVADVEVTEDAETLAVFVFSVHGGNVELGRGTLGVAIQVHEQARCGDGVVDPGEACDDGLQAGEPHHCDADCAFVCEGACPLRVDPGASESGDGRTWSSPIELLGEALAQQALLGGGEVWVRGPGPFDALAGNPETTLARLGPGVSMIGGFAGTERRRDERDPTAFTIITGASVGDLPRVAPLIDGASGSRVEAFLVTDHDGTVLRFHGAEGFSTSNVTIVNSSAFNSSLVDILDSSGNLDDLDISDSTGIGNDAVTGLRAGRSHVVLSNSEFSQLTSVDDVAGISAIDSTLILYQDTFAGLETGGIGRIPGLSSSDSSILAVESLWLRNRSDLPTVAANDSEFVAVNSHWEANGSVAATAQFRNSRASFLNSSFVENRVQSGSTLFVIDSHLDVVSSTFYQNTVSWPDPATYPRDIGQQGDSLVELYDSYSSNGPYAIFEPYSGSGNCLVERGDLEIRDDSGYQQVYLTQSLGCTDIGNDDAARDAGERARAFAASVGGAIPLTVDWWQVPAFTSTYPLCEDAGPIDPGRHFAAPFCGAP